MNIYEYIYIIYALYSILNSSNNIKAYCKNNNVKKINNLS